MAINIPIFSSLDPKGFDRAKKEFKTLEGFGAKAGFILKKAFLPLAAATGAVGTFAYKAAQSASDLNEELAKSGQIFGRASKGIEQFGDTAARNLGQSKQEAIAAASTFGIMGKAAGLTGTDLAGFSTRLVTLTSDLASFNNARPEDVVQALGAALRGESEPMRRFGVLLNDAALKAEAMAMGIYKGKGPLEQQAKILAANSLIFKQTSDAQGDFIRTSDGAANQQRILKAALKDITTDIGRAFLPALQNIVGGLAAVTTAFSEQGAVGAMRAFRGEMKKLTRDNDGTINGLGKFVNALIVVRNAIAKVINVGITLANILPGKDFQAIEMVDQLGTNFNELYGAMSQVTVEAEKQRKLQGFMGPVVSRDLDILTMYQDDYRASIANTIPQLEDMNDAAGGSASTLDKQKTKTNAATKALKAYREALTAATEGVKDQFSPALQAANEKLTAAQGVYNDFYKDIHTAIGGIFDIGAAWREAADSEGAKTFFGVLADQSDKARRLAANLKTLIQRGLDDPTLLQAILNQGADTGLAISQAIIDGGEDGLKSLKGLTNTVSFAADEIAKLSADKWFKSGVDQAQAMVDGINSLIADTEFALKFVVTVEGAQQLAGMFGTGVEQILAGGQAAPMFDPAGFSAAAFAALGQPASVSNVRTSSVNINVNGGDPRAVVDALRSYAFQNGSVPVRTS